MADPVEDGLVASLARPGGNVTRTTFLGPELVTKRLQLLAQVVPQHSRVAVLWHPHAYGDRTMAGMVKEAEHAAQTLAIAPVAMPASLGCSSRAPGHAALSGPASLFGPTTSKDEARGGRTELGMLRSIRCCRDERGHYLKGIRGGPRSATRIALV
jgi:hypothetical protein